MSGVHLDEIVVGWWPAPRAASAPLTPFIGSMQSFIFNGNDFFRLAPGLDNVRVTAGVVEDVGAGAGVGAVTFRTPASYVVTRVPLHATFSMRLRIKTTQRDALLLYSGGGGGGGGGGDFFALELSAGRVRYVFNVGSGARSLSCNDVVVNDNRWHDIALLRPALGQHVLRVDHAFKFNVLSDATAVHFDLDGRLYVGGATGRVLAALAPQVRARHGYQGCMADLDLNGEQRPLLEYAELPRRFRKDVVQQCEGT